MRLMIKLVLAAVTSGLVAGPAAAQSYGGASGGDLLGYRSSSANYYRRQGGAKARGKSAKRKARKARPHRRVRG